MKLREPLWVRAHPLQRMVQVDVGRIALHTFLLGTALAVVLTIPVAVHQQAETRISAGAQQAEQERVLQLAVLTIRQEMDAVLSDVRYLSQHNELRAYLEDPSPERRRDLAREYLILAKQKRVFDQIRFIGMDGKEQVRVDFADGAPVIRSSAELQDKRDLAYFQETQWLSPGQMFVSAFELNIEQGVIERPLKPTLRFVVPVADSQGQIRGMVALNYLGQRLVDKLTGLAAGASRSSRIWLLNPEGYWLIGPRRQDEWGFMPGAPMSPTSPGATRAPFWRQAMQESSGVHRDHDARVRFERIYPLDGGALPRATDLAAPVAAEHYFWTLALAAPPAADDVFPQQLWAIYGTLLMFAYFAAGGFVLVVHRYKDLAQSLEKMIDRLPSLIAYIDAEQRYRFNNRAYEGLFGLETGRIFGKTIRELFGDAYYQGVRPYVEQALAGIPVVYERQVPYPGSELRDMVVAFLPDTTAQGETRGFFVVANDVSLMKQSEQRERRRILELAHVSRLASMGEMATEIAHEINQPLAAIALYSAAGLRTLPLGVDRAQMEGWLEAINSQAKRASEIVRRVRGFVQKESLQYAPVNLNQVAEEVAALLRHEARSLQLDIVLHLAHELPSVQGERILLEQVVFNLVRNAMDALLPQSGERCITLVTALDADQVCVEVRDTGLGVDPALGERVFDSFVSGGQKGVGMGLAISRSIVEAHGGQLRYVLNPEGGATFLFCLARETS